MGAVLVFMGILETACVSAMAGLMLARSQSPYHYDNVDWEKEIMRPWNDVPLQPGKWPTGRDLMEREDECAS